MLTDLLRTLAEGRPRTMAELAAELGTDSGTLHVAFERCQRMGYLERVGAGCDEGCCDACGASCASPKVAAEAGDRGEATGPAWWRLTESGLRVVKASGGGAQT